MVNILGVAEVDDKGRCTIPSAVRDALKAKAGFRLAFTLDKDGRITVQDATNVR